MKKESPLGKNNYTTNIQSHFLSLCPPSAFYIFCALYLLSLFSLPYMLTQFSHSSICSLYSFSPLSALFSFSPLSTHSVFSVLYFCIPYYPPHKKESIQKYLCTLYVPFLGNLLFDLKKLIV